MNIKMQNYMNNQCIITNRVLRRVLSLEGGPSLTINILLSNLFYGGGKSRFFQTVGIAMWIVVLQQSAVMVLAEEPPDLDEKIHFNIPR